MQLAWPAEGQLLCSNSWASIEMSIQGDIEINTMLVRLWKDAVISEGLHLDR
jgi:hypothetical protein